MSWLNNSFNTIKGQLSTLAQEVLAETAGPGDEEYRGRDGEPTEQKSLLQLYSETEAERDELLTICGTLKKEVRVFGANTVSPISLPHCCPGFHSFSIKLWDFNVNALLSFRPLN